MKKQSVTIKKNYNDTPNKKQNLAYSLNQPEFLDDYYTIMNKLVGIDISDEWKANIKFHINNATKMAQVIENGPIDENTIDLSNTFHPGER